MTLGSAIRGKLLYEYYEMMRREILQMLKGFLFTCRGTIILYGAEDINGAPVVNDLIRIMDSNRVSTNTFFLTSVYTEYHSCDSDYYVKLVEDFMRDFGSFEPTNGVFTDNKKSVKNQREEVARSMRDLFHPRIKHI